MLRSERIEALATVYIQHDWGDRELIKPETENDHTPLWIAGAVASITAILITAHLYRSKKNT